MTDKELDKELKRLSEWSEKLGKKFYKLHDTASALKAEFNEFIEAFNKIAPYLEEDNAEDMAKDIANIFGFDTTTNMEGN